MLRPSQHAPRGVPCVYLGYDDVNNTYLVREWISGQVYYTADLTFHPHVFPYRTNREREATRVHQYDDAAPTLTMPSQIRIPAPPRPKSRRQRDYLSSAESTSTPYPTLILLQPASVPTTRLPMSRGLRPPS